MIWWNGIWPDNLGDVLLCYRSMYNNTIPDGDDITIGVHGYAINDYSENAIPNFLSRVCNIVWSHGYRHCRFSLSEIAIPNAHLGELAYRAQWNWLLGIDSVGKGNHLPIELISTHYFTHCPDCPVWAGFDWDEVVNTRFWIWDDDFQSVEPTNSGRALQDYVTGSAYNPYP